MGWLLRREWVCDCCGEVLVEPWRLYLRRLLTGHDWVNDSVVVSLDWGHINGTED